MSTPVVQAVRTVVLGVALAALVGVAGGQVKTTVKAMTLTTMDYIEIRQLVNRYAFALDTGSSNGYDYALCLPQTGSSCCRTRKGASSSRRSRAVHGSVRTTPCTTS
jgi:hypothetical protein